VGLALSALLFCGWAKVTYADPVSIRSATWTSDGVQHEYILYTDAQVSWAGASSWISCNLLGHHLATITNAAEQTFLNSSIFVSFRGECWLGGYQNPIDTKVTTANWTWVTGEAWFYTNWNGGEPNDFYGPGSEQYLAGNYNGWKWNDEGLLAT
jgi:hypothetical protein